MINFSNISTSDKALILIIISAFILFIAICIIFYLNAWKQKLRYAKMEIQRARNERELRHWKREVKIVYWSLIPGLSTRTIKKIVRFFRKDKKQK